MKTLNLFDESAYRQIVDRLTQLRSDSPRQWGKMDVAQMLAHCCLAFKVPLSKTQPPAMYPLRLIGWLFRPMLYSDKPWKQGAPTAPSFVIKDQRNFDEEKQRLNGLIDQFYHAGPTVAGRHSHPAFGKFTPEQWGKMMWKHLDHHFRQFNV